MDMSHTSRDDHMLNELDQLLDWERGNLVQDALWLVWDETKWHKFNGFDPLLAS